MELVRISLALSACCFACSDSPVSKEKEVSVSLSSQLDRNTVTYGRGTNEDTFTCLLAHGEASGQLEILSGL